MNSSNMVYNSVCNCKITSQFKDMKYEYGKKVIKVSSGSLTFVKVSTLLSNVP